MWFAGILWLTRKPLHDSDHSFAALPARGVAFDAEEHS